MFTFNAQEHQPMKEYAPLPDGKYVFFIGNVEMTNSKAGHAMIKITFFGGENSASSARITEHLVVGHPSDKVREIANSTLRSICDAIGVSSFDERTLHKLTNKKLVLKIGQSTYTNQYGEKVPNNKINGYLPCEKQKKEQQSSDDLWNKIDSQEIAGGSVNADQSLLDDDITF